MFLVNSFWFGEEKQTRFGVKVLLFGVKFSLLLVILTEYGVTF